MIRFYKAEVDGNKIKMIVYNTDNLAIDMLILERLPKSVQIGSKYISND